MFYVTSMSSFEFPDVLAIPFLLLLVCLHSLRLTQKILIKMPKYEALPTAHGTFFL